MGEDVYLVASALTNSLDGMGVVYKEAHIIGNNLVKVVVATDSEEFIPPVGLDNRYPLERY